MRSVGYDNFMSSHNNSEQEPNPGVAYGNVVVRRLPRSGFYRVYEAGAPKDEDPHAQVYLTNYTRDSEDMVRFSVPAINQIRPGDILEKLCKVDVTVDVGVPESHTQATLEELAALAGATAFEAARVAGTFPPRPLALESSQILLTPPA